ncbi:MAG: hypothetical protein WBP36_10240 [Thermoanaerobaculia bacterium]
MTSLWTSSGGRRNSIVLVVVVAVWGLAVAVLDRPGWPRWIGEEATHVLQAESLARDLDAVFDAKDRRRVASAGVEITGLSLRNGRLDEEPVFARPVFYSAYLAPFVRLAPARGPTVANLMLLCLAVGLASRRLHMRLGWSAPWLVGLFLFTSVVFRYLQVAEPPIFLLALSVSTFFLVFGLEEPVSEGPSDMYRPLPTRARVGWRWGAAGRLLGLMAAFNPVYILLALPAVAAAPRDNRRAALACLSAGLLAVLALSGLIEWNRAGSWQMPFPEPSSSVLLAAEPLGREPLGDLAGKSLSSPFEAAPGRPFPVRISGRLTAWNVAYSIAGRHLGLLPYFLPTVLVLGLWTRGSGRSSLVAICWLAIGLIALLSPFDFAGGPTAIGNRWFVPLFGALWFVPASQPRPQWLGITAALAGLFLYPVWLTPAGSPVDSDGSLQHAKSFVASYLPLETSQRPLPGFGEILGRGAWVRSLRNTVRLQGDGRWQMEGGKPAELLIAAPLPLDSVYFEFGGGAEPELEVGGGELGNMVLQPNGRVAFHVGGLDPVARHPAWWDEAEQNFYDVRLRMPGAADSTQVFSVTGLSLPERKTDQ